MSGVLYVLVSWQGEKAYYATGSLTVTTANVWEDYEQGLHPNGWVKVAEGTREEMERFKSLAQKE